jgi:hypothetical protein
VNGVINLHVSSPVEEKIMVRLFDVAGHTLYKTVATNIIRGENAITVPAPAVGKGNICFAEVVNATDGSTIGVIKIVF